MSDMSRTEAIEVLKDIVSKPMLYSNFIMGACRVALASLETDEAYQLEYERTTKNDLGVDAVSRADARSLICDIDLKHHTFGMSRKAFKDLYNGMDELPSITPQEPRWIPVSERLPENCGMYIVTRKIYDCPDAPIFVSDESWFDGQNTWHNDNRINHERGYLSDVIAWMTLPQPYSEVEK